MTICTSFFVNLHKKYKKAIILKRGKTNREVSDFVLSELMNIYPESLLNPEETELKKRESYYLVEEGGDSLYILVDKLNQKEIDLLKILAKNQNHQADESKRLEKILIQGIIDDAIANQQGQIVYLKINHLEQANFQLWKNTLQDSMEEIIEIQSMANDLVVILLSVKINGNDVLTKLQEVMQSLDQDFNLFTQGMIGQTTYLSAQIKDVYAYERLLFESFILKQKVEGITTISEVLIHQLGSLFKDKQPELPQLKNYLTNKMEARDLIQLLFKHQGNLSQTADELFIHRNTLTYRMKQFYEQTGFDLGCFSDLIVCYLFIV